MAATARRRIAGQIGGQGGCGRILRFRAAAVPVGLPAETVSVASRPTLGATGAGNGQNHRHHDESKTSREFVIHNSHNCVVTKNNYGLT